jgi:gamma-glutamyltranspeptidase/glutathione hydrolase
MLVWVCGLAFSKFLTETMAMRRLSEAVAAALLVAACGASAQERGYGRSMVVTSNGIVATSYVQASEAGARVLEQGGSAIDAAIAANAVLAVAEPMSDGIGGDLFAMYRDGKTGKLYGLNASGTAPKGLTVEHLKAKGLTGMAQAGIDSVTVPGAVDGWAKLHERFGRLPWKGLFQPAIYYARNGYAVPEVIHEYWKLNMASVGDDAETKRLFLPGGKVPETGQVFKNPELAGSLELIANEGESAFYKGAIAQQILKTSQEHGGVMTAADLAGYSAEWVEPISVKYRDWTVYELPPNGDGFAALEMLNIMGQFKASPQGPLSVEELHKKIEAMKMAYADVKEFDGDPRFAKIPVGGLLSEANTKRRAAELNPAKANCEVAPEAPKESDTTYLTVVDKDGNMVSLIQSISSFFGSGVTVKGAGILLHNRGARFSFDPKSGDVLGGGRRPFHSIIPAMMNRGTQWIGFGIMGGFNQPLAHAQFVSNVADYGMNVQAAMEEARFTVDTDIGVKIGCKILIESRVKPAVLEKLTSMGHVFDVREEYSTTMGRGQAILHDTVTGMNYGGSEPRADGAAVPEGPRLP